MKARDHILAVQAALGIPERQRFPRVGPLTKAAFNRLSVTDPNDEFLLPSSTEAYGEAKNVNDRTIALIKHFEGLSLKAYWDDDGKCWTIGWGHTGLQHKDGTVFRGREITSEKADWLLRYDMDQFEARVTTMVNVPITEDQYGALVSFDFNTGGLHKSTLLDKLNDMDYDGAAEQFPRWNRSGGKVLRGLTLRRLSEKNLFNGLSDYIVES